jgi:hypothetical protein
MYTHSLGRFSQRRSWGFRPVRHWIIRYDVSRQRTVLVFKGRNVQGELHNPWFQASAAMLMRSAQIDPLKMTLWCLETSDYPVMQRHVPDERNPPCRFVLHIAFQHYTFLNICCRAYKSKKNRRVLMLKMIVQYIQSYQHACFKKNIRL